ncbi:MAG: hypothetical protein AAF492_18525, partial [Verrucomicrobiota bacterium]
MATSRNWTVTNGVYLTNGTMATLTNVPIGTITHYLFSVDDDKDRPGDTLRSGYGKFETLYDPIAPPAIADLTGDVGFDPQSEIDLTWTAAPDAGELGFITLSPWRTYRVYISDDGDTPTTNDVFVDGLNGGSTNLTTIVTTNTTVSNLAFGTTYRLSLVGVDVAGNIGPIMNVVTVKLASFALTSGVAEVMSIVGDTNAALVGWNAFTVPGTAASTNCSARLTASDSFEPNGWSPDATTPEESVFSSDDDYERYTGNGQERLVLSDFGFSIPAGATILGIEVRIEGQGTSGNPNHRELTGELTKDKGLSQAGDDDDIVFLLNVDRIFFMGGQTDLWNTTWTPAEINSPNFGIRLQGQSIGPRELLIDHLQIAVCYSTPATGARVARVYDGLYQDSSHWTDASSNRWRHLFRGASDHLVDRGQISGVPPRQLGLNGNPSMRFYRAALEGQWQPTNTARLATPEIYVLKAIHLYEGQNWVGFPGVPDTNTPAFMFGHLLPAGTSAVNATKISWFDRTTNTDVMATNQIYLKDNGT